MYYWFVAHEVPGPEVKIVPTSLYNMTVAFINIFRPDDKQIPYRDVKVVSRLRKATPREEAEKLLELFDEPGVVRYKGNSLF